MLTEYDSNHGYGPEDFDDEKPCEWTTCPTCLGSGTYSTCIDDLCHGGECIHGDDSTCRKCEGKGEVPVAQEHDAARGGE